MDPVPADRLDGVDLRVTFEREDVERAQRALGLTGRPFRRTRIDLYDYMVRGADGIPPAMLRTPLSRVGIWLQQRTPAPGPGSSSSSSTSGGSGGDPRTRVTLFGARRPDRPDPDPTDPVEPVPAGTTSRIRLRQDWSGDRLRLVASLDSAGPPLPALAGEHDRFLTEWARVRVTPARLTRLGSVVEDRWRTTLAGMATIVRRWQVPTTGPGPEPQAPLTLIELLQPVTAADAAFLQRVLVSTLRGLGLDAESTAAPLHLAAALWLSSHPPPRSQSPD